MGKRIKIHPFLKFALHKPFSGLSFLLLKIHFLILFPLISNAQHFLEYQDSANIDHVVDHVASIGGGAAFFDADNDGDDDLYITAGNERDHFYVNNGDGTFTYNSVNAGFVVTKLYYTTGVIAGDIDNDGFTDLFVTTWFSSFSETGQNLLFKNNGDGTFTEIWSISQTGEQVQTFDATFLDYDLDGFLDIYAVNYVEETGFLYDDDGNIIGYDHKCYTNNLYRNKGDGTFEEKAFTLNIQNNGCGLATTATDFDMDGDMDIYIANDFGDFVLPNQLYQFNSDNGFFWPMGEELNANTAMYGMGIAVGDVDQDLDPDFYITNFGKNVLLENNGNTFNDITDATNSGDEWVVQDSAMAVGWGTAFLDIDNDTDLDLYIANGRIPSPDFLTSSFLSNDALLINDGNTYFSNKSEEYGIENYSVSRGMAFSDYDNDGDLDIISVVQDVPLSTPDGKTVLFNNQKGNEKNWVQINLQGITVNRDAIGSKIYLYADGQTWLQEIDGGSSHGSHNSIRAHFGLGDITQIDSAAVVWTGGIKRQVEHDLTINQLHEIIEDTAQVINSIENIKNDFSVSVSPNPANNNFLIKLNNTPYFYKGEIAIYNSFGVLIKKEKMKNEKNNIIINSNAFPSGIYFIAVDINGSISFKKTIIQH